ncbi:glycosyltransferase [Novipirellula sp. SH528]|uniref:glycosyltransferase n=1 Tax=Novipirellula sp. SH528 TaxID=3454466 RepID=UPI003FA04939
MISFTQFAILIGSTLFVWSLVHFAVAWFFDAQIVRMRIAVSDNASACTFAPKASVLMSLRGRDPRLQLNLQSLLNQAYDDFEIIVVIDSRQDPAWQVTQEVKLTDDAADRLKILELQEPSSTCSLKCSSLIQAAQQIRRDSEVVVLVDADVVPHRHWLRDAVRPLVNPKIGVATGNQWYAPDGIDAGSLLRSIWNSGAIAATAINANPWAGTCAMRLSDLKRSGLIEIWMTSVVDDGPIKSAFDRLGLKVYFDPRLIMVNRDPCTTAFAGRYVTRMLTWSRIYEKTFINTVVHAVAMVALLATSLAVFLIALMTKNAIAASSMGLSMLLSNLVMFAGFRSTERAVSHAIRCRSSDNHLAPMGLAKSIRVFVLIPVCQVAHVYWTIKAIFTRQAHWRNITYRLLPQQRVEMVAYQPYIPEQRISTATQRSI